MKEGEENTSVQEKKDLEERERDDGDQKTDKELGINKEKIKEDIGKKKSSEEGKKITEEERTAKKEKEDA